MISVMDHKYKALLQNIPTRHVITAITNPADRQQQISKLRNLDINNFFILGSLQSIREVLGNEQEQNTESSLSVNELNVNNIRAILSLNVYAYHLRDFL